MLSKMNAAQKLRPDEESQASSRTHSAAALQHTRCQLQPASRGTPFPPPLTACAFSAHERQQMRSSAERRISAALLSEKGTGGGETALSSSLFKCTGDWHVNPTCDLLRDPSSSVPRRTPRLDTSAAERRVSGCSLLGG
uniref:Uncharacterized protein n=1 Tax=Buteo japonicus TaxID=224669 RepID=A0A8C0BUB4_9AVES